MTIAFLLTEDFIITLEEFTDIWGSITGQTNADSLNLFIAMAKRSEADEIDLEDDSTLFIDDNDLWQLWLTMVVGQFIYIIILASKKPF